LEKDQLVFSQEELEAFFPEGLALDKRILCFGLLQSAESVGVGISFHFLHLTFQEYLAALYLTRQPMDKQLENFKTYKWKLGTLSPHRFKMAWRFFFGINSDLEFNGDTTSFIQQTLTCVVNGEINASNNHLSLCHCAFEARNDLINENITQYLVWSNMIKFGSPRTAHDCSAILYVIANLQECGCDLKVDFGNASENQVKELMHILTSKNGKLWISSLDLSGSRLTVSSLQALESAVRGDVLAELENLYLEGSLTSDADTNAKWLATLSGHCPNLEVLDLSNNNLGVPGASAVAKLHVSGWLYLSNANLGNKGLTKSLKVISHLELANNDIHAVGGGLPSTDSISCEAVGRQLCQMPQTSTIVILDLNHNSFTGDGIHILAGFMHLCPRLRYLHIRDCGITSDDLIWLLGKLKSSSPGLCSKLELWVLKDNQLDGRGVSALMDHLPLLPRLWCGEITLGIDSLSNNPVIHNSEVMERLREELTRHRKRYEEQTRHHREREEEKRREIEKRLEEELQKEVR
jgi:Ran GTPase-activating protein (RanGAP) involved in mRNA processing and transport